MRTALLVRRAQAGDRASREALARAWLPRVYGAALARTGRAAEAEDLTQEAFLRAFRSLGTLRNPARFGPWIFRIVRRLAVDGHRRTHVDTLGQAGAALADPTPPPSVGGGDTVDAWRALTETVRLVIWLHIVDGVTFRDIAELMGTSKSAVYRAYRRGLARMRKELASC